MPMTEAKTVGHPDKTGQTEYALQRFKNGIGVPLPERALRVWMLLWLCAQQGRDITYGEVAVVLGYASGTRAARGVKWAVALAGQVCVETGLPPLNVLVVNQDRGVPGEEVILGGYTSVKVARAAVVVFDWLSIRPPTPGALRRLWSAW